MAKKATKTEVAKKFATLLFADLGKEAIEQINRENEKYRAQGIHDACASHDFVDANDYMVEAYKYFYGEASLDAYNEDVFSFLNDAWKISKENNFFI
jgi:hypothetical protein